MIMGFQVKGTIQMDMSYASILIFGEQRRLYRESKMAYMVSNKYKPQKFPVCAMETELGSSTLFNEITNNTENQHAKKGQQVEEIDRKGWWHMNFDGAIERNGDGASIWIIISGDESNFFSYKISFDCTNNMAEYEALVLGLEVLNSLGAKKIFVFGDSELVIKQVNNTYQTKDVRMKVYRNLIIELLENFEEHNFTIKPREQNNIANYLVVSAILFTIPIHSSNKYEVEIRHRPTIPDHIIN